MKYTKPALKFQDQASLLIARGLVVADPVELEDYLKQVNYYRLSGYWYNFKETDPASGVERLKPGTTFEVIRDHYEFDRELRLLIMGALERIEVAVFRTRLVEEHTAKYGPFGYSQQKNYNPYFKIADFNRLMNSIKADEQRSYAEFINRYRSKYTAEKYLPLWMVTELMSFGQLLTFYRNQHSSFKNSVSYQFKLFSKVFDSWLLTLNTVRNDCAHHNRLWNRPLPNKPKLPDRKNDPRWHVPDTIPNDRVYVVLSMIQTLLANILPTNQWKNSVEKLLITYPTIPHILMGIPKDWQKSPLWK
jgi:abortive infection bacteriophage resistance protein